MHFEVVDVVFAVLIAVLAVRGALRGLVAEVGSMAALILGLGGAFLFYKPAAALLSRYFKASMWTPLIAFLVLFLLLYLLVKLCERLLHSLVERLSLDRLDSAFGFFLGIAEGLLLVGVLLFLINWQPFFASQKLLADSFFARMLVPVLPSPERIFPPQAKGGAHP
jgi:membrane protein required for colicin V production